MILQALRQYAALLALSVLVAGCANLPSSMSSGQEIGSIQGGIRTYQENLNLNGRLSVRYQGANMEESLHGSFVWEQTPEHTAVTLLSPLGQTMAIISLTSEGATLTQNGYPVRTAIDVDALTADTLGWPLPIAGLRYWLQGFAVDTSNQPFVATPQTADVVTRDGWQIRYGGWQEDPIVSRQRYPKRIDLARTTEQAGDVSIRIVIDTWQAH